MEMILNRYGIKLRRVNQFYFRGTCPLPSHSSAASDESFGVHTGKNAWACQSQSCITARNGKRGGNILDFVSIQEQCSLRDAAIKLATWFNVSSGTGESQPGKQLARSNPSQLVAEREKDGEVTDDILPDAENKPLGFALRNIDHSHPYLTARGISKEIAEQFGVGFFAGKGSMAGRIIIPIHSRKGELVAYAGRSIDESEPKYKFPGGFRKSLELFNLHRALAARTGYVIVTEGFFDAMKVTAAGYASVVALMGASMSEVQEKLLADFRRVVLLFDGDEAGREGTRTTALRLMLHTFVKAINLPDTKQPDQLSTEEITATLRSI